MRIIAGKHKGRKIFSPQSKDIRPTTGMTREALFSILKSGRFLNEDGTSVLDDAIVLDLFSGSGAFAFEALSRGAQKVILVDKEPESLSMAKQTADKLGERDNVVLLKFDACFLPKAKFPCDIIFIDPPYHNNLVAPALKSLVENDWLKNGSILIIEMGKREDFTLPDNFIELDNRNYGKAKIYILEYQA